MRMRWIFLILLIFISGCLQGAKVQQGAEVKETLVPKKIVPVPYPEEAKSTANPIPATEESLAIGISKYETFCSLCHGKRGRGGEEVTRSFEVEPSILVSDAVKRRTDGELYWAISNGVNGTKMLAWKELLGNEEIWHIVNHIRALQKSA